MSNHLYYQNNQILKQLKYGILNEYSIDNSFGMVLGKGIFRICRDADDSNADFSPNSARLSDPEYRGRRLIFREPTFVTPPIQSM